MRALSSDAAHEFGALNTLLLVVVLGICIMSAYVIKSNHFYYLPESAAAILVGATIGALARFMFSKEEMDFLTFNPEVFFFLLLPPIIFEAGYALKKKDFFNNLWTISLFTVIGTLVSTFVIGYGVYIMGKLNLVHIDTSSPMEALTFGALLSSVDPMATLSIMGNPEMACDPLLYSLVFGESVLNDAVAISLFKTFSAYYESEEEFSWISMLKLIGNFSIISLGSVVLGVSIALCCCYICKNTMLRKYPDYEVALLFLFAYGSYSFSESMGLSGIMSLFSCGVVLSYYNNHNLSATSQVTTSNIFKTLSTLSETFVFMYLGIGIFTGSSAAWNVPFIGLTIFACIAGRALNIFPLSFLANLTRKNHIPVRMQTVIWFAGLRGAVSFAMSQNMPGDHKDVYVSTTLAIVIVTTFVLGGLTEPMLTSMDMKKKNDHAHNHYTDLHARGGEQVRKEPPGGGGSPYEKVADADPGSDDENETSAELTLTGLGFASKKKPRTSGVPADYSFLQRIDANYMQPLFGKPQF